MWMWLIGQEEWRNKSLIYSLLGSRYVARVCWSRPVIGWQLLPNYLINSTQITDGFGVGHGHRDIWQLLCFRCMQTITTDTVIAYIIPTTTGPIYYQRQAGTERSDVAACASVKANRIPYYSSVGGCSSHFRAGPAMEFVTQSQCNMRDLLLPSQPHSLSVILASTNYMYRATGLLRGDKVQGTEGSEKNTASALWHHFFVN